MTIGFISHVLHVKFSRADIPILSWTMNVVCENSLLLSYGISTFFAVPGIHGGLRGGGNVEEATILRIIKTYLRSWLSKLIIQVKTCTLSEHYNSRTSLEWHWLNQYWGFKRIKRHCTSKIFTFVCDILLMCEIACLYTVEVLLSVEKVLYGLFF